MHLTEVGSTQLDRRKDWHLGSVSLQTPRVCSPRVMLPGSFIKFSKHCLFQALDGKMHFPKWGGSRLGPPDETAVTTEHPEPRSGDVEEGARDGCSEKVTLELDLGG